MAPTKILIETHPLKGSYHSEIGLLILKIEDIQLQTSPGVINYVLWLKFEYGVHENCDQIAATLIGRPTVAVHVIKVACYIKQVETRAIIMETVTTIDSSLAL